MSEWNRVKDALPENLERVLVCIQYGKYRGVDVADYVAPQTVLAEDFLHEDCDQFAEYDKEKDCYWTPAGFYQSEYFTDMNYYIIDSITHWMKLPLLPKKETPKSEKSEIVNNQ